MRESPVPGINIRELVTRGDLSEAKAELKADIAALRSDMQALEYRLIIKLGAFIAVAAGVIIAVAAGVIIAVLRVSH